MGIKNARKRAGLTQLQVADALNIPQSTIATWEIGAALPRANKLKPLAELFNCTVDELLEEAKE